MNIEVVIENLTNSFEGKAKELSQTSSKLEQLKAELNQLKGALDLAYQLKAEDSVVPEGEEDTKTNE